MTYYKPLLYGCIFSIGLAGCFHDSDDKKTETQALTGKAADGYLANATVCLDLNGNKVCDAGEPSATTGPNGDFTINASASDVNSATIIVEIIPNVTEDKDNPGVKLTKAYSLTAPPGYTFVSPITTLVQAEVEKSGGSISNAENILKARLGTEVDFDSDYVAGQTDPEVGTSFKAEYEKLHKVAKVVATIISNNLDNVSSATSDTNFKDVLKLVVSKIDVALEEINGAVASDTSTTFDPDTFLTNNEDINNSTGVSTETLEDELALQEDLESAVETNLGTLLASGLFWLEYEYDEIDGIIPGYGKTTFDGTTTTNTFFAWDGSAFTQDISGGDGGGGECLDCPASSELVLLSTGWEVANFDSGGGDGPTFDSVQADGSVLMEEGPITVRLTGEEFSLEGNKIKGTLSGTNDWEWANLIPLASTFGVGAKGYKIKMSTFNDVFIMPEFSDTCITGENGEDQSAITGNCNLVRFLSGSGGNLGADTDPTAIQADTFTPIVTTRGTGTNPLNYKALLIGFDETADTGYLAEFGPNNLIFYYKVVVQNDVVTSFNKVLEAPYSQQTVHGKNLIVFDVPFELGLPFFDDGSNDTSGGTDQHDDGPKPTALFLSAHAGYWRWGGVIEAGTVIPDDAPFVYNEAAMTDITEAFDSSLIPSPPESPAL